MRLVAWPSRISARSSVLFNLHTSSLGHITTSPRQPRQQNLHSITRLQPNLASSAAETRSYAFKTFRSVCILYGLQNSAAWSFTHSHSHSRGPIRPIIHHHLWLPTGQAPLHHSAKLCTILHPHTWLISVIATPPTHRLCSGRGGGQPSHLHH